MLILYSFVKLNNLPLEESLAHRKHLITVNYYCYYYNYSDKLGEWFIFLGKGKETEWEKVAEKLSWRLIRSLASRPDII